MSLNAYRRTRSMTESPRAAEHRLMTEITAQMVEARRARLEGDALMQPLHRNREVWGVFAATCGAGGNQLPPALRARIISIALWVDRFTSDVMAGRGSMDDLIAVNLDIIAGLAGGGAMSSPGVAR